MNGHKSLLCCLLAALFLAPLLSGCVGVRSIQEDSIQDGLPEIDPEGGISRNITATVYYWLSGEPYLVPIRHSIAGRSGEIAEKAIVRALLNGVPPLAQNVSNVFPAGTEATAIARNGNIIYVSLSEEYLDDAALRQVREEATQLLLNNLISEQEYDARVQAAEEELYMRRRMGVYAIVNSITKYNASVRVQIYVDKSGAGGAERISYDELGMLETAETDSRLLEPLPFEETVVTTPASVAECVLRRLKAGEPGLVYGLFAETENRYGQKPAYADLAQSLAAVGQITDYVVYNYSILQNANYANVEVDIQITDAAGNSRWITRAQLQMKNEGNLYRLGYFAFLEALEEGAA